MDEKEEPKNVNVERSSNKEVEVDREVDDEEEELEERSTDPKEQELDIPAGKSVKVVARWALGSMYFIEHYPNSESVPTDAVVQWDDDGAILCLRPQCPALTSEADGWAEAVTRVNSTSSGIFQITPGTMVKVVSWKDGFQTEARSIRFINERHPEIPTTRVIYDWIDHNWTRSFMIMRRASGILLSDVMIYMTDRQVQDVADQVAVHIKTITQNTSPLVETVDHCGLYPNRLIGWMPLASVPHDPSCYTEPWPRFNSDEFKTHLQEASNMTDIPESGPDFVLYNSDITTHNLFVQFPFPGTKGQLTEMIDWGFTAYWPRYWVATCAHADGPFYLNKYGIVDVRWPKYLNKALVRAGFESKTKWWVAFDKASDKLRQKRAGKEYEDYMAAIRLENSYEDHVAGSQLKPH
ncbi:hypothetical protein MMC17_002528 [Xylographa soralifera]|nr:hypothetical protein [Xylographa soralifera]